MKLIEEIINFGQSGSRKSQVWAIGSVALLAGPSLGLEAEQTHWFAGLCAAYIIGRAWHDAALARPSM